MLATSSGKSNQEQVCLTYGGFTEMNTGVAGCVGWDAPLVGGQTWELATGSEGGMVIRQTGTDGGVGEHALLPADGRRRADDGPVAAPERRAQPRPVADDHLPRAV